MRRLTTPLVMLLLAAVVVMLAIGLLSDGAPRTDKASRSTAATGATPTRASPSEQRVANGAVLASIPLPAGSRFFTKDDNPPPRGGVNTTTYAYFASAPGQAPSAVIDHFKASLTGTSAGGGWTLVGELSVPSRVVAKFQKGDAWLEVSASEIDVAAQRVPGFTVLVNAKDAKVFGAL